MNRSFKWASRICFGTSICALASIPMREYFRDYVKKRSDPEVLEYARDNLETRMQEIEEKLKIKFRGKPPGINELTNEDEEKDNSGSYDKYTNQIYIHTGLLKIPGWNFKRVVAQVATLGYLEDVNLTLDHELGHFYQDSLNESLGLGNWSNFIVRPTKTKVISIKLISEGTAEYFEMKMSGEEDNFTDEDWPENLEDFIIMDGSLVGLPIEWNNHVIYKGGYHLVKPIIDKHGEKGIKYIIFNTPREEEILELPSYQQRILQELDSGRSLPFGIQQ